MASQRTCKAEVLRVVSWFIAFPAVIAVLAVVGFPAALAQAPQVGQQRAPSSGSAHQTAGANSTTKLAFLPVVTYDTGEGLPTSIAVGDVNGDGRPDVVVTSDTLAVFLGNGDGTFQPPATYHVADAYGLQSVAIADVNGDGKPDLVVAQSGSDQSHGLVTVLLNNGDGTFAPDVEYDSGAYHPASVAVADVNGDGKPDLLVASFDGTVGVMLGNGDGTFQSVVTYSSGGGSSRSIAVADVNGDGKPDVIVTQYFIYSNADVGVLLGNGDGRSSRL